MYKSVRVRMPDGEIKMAELTSRTSKGYRSARVTHNGKRVRGRITARHGFDARVHNFEFLAEDVPQVFGKKDYILF